MKKISNSELIRKIDYSENAKPAYVENIITIADQGFRTYLSDVITKDEQRRKNFVASQQKKTIE